MKRFLLFLFLIIPIPVVAQTYLPKIKQFYEWKKEKISSKLEAYKPVYEDINITAHLDFYHFYKPNFSELFFLVEKHLIVSQ